MSKLKFFIPVFVVALTQFACRSNATIDEVVRSRFQPLIDGEQAKEKRYQSVLVAVVTPFETKLVPLGKLSEKGDIADEKTIFEIGSITKGFVGLALANENLQHGLALDQPFDTFKLPAFGGKPITWRHLAQHTSGLPRRPENHKPTDPLQPHVEYDSAKLKEFLATFHPKSEPGAVFEYSNLGAGIVGYALELRHRKSLEQVLREMVVDKLAMQDTRIFLSSEQQSRLAPGYMNGDPIPAWQWKSTSVLQGAGALHSSMHDMTIFLRMMMGLGNEELMPAVALATQPTFQDGANSQIGIFWNRLRAENIVWHNGGTYGATSFIGYDPDQMVGVVVLANSLLINDKGVDARLDRAAIATIREVAPLLKMEKPIKALKAYDTEIARRRAEFAKAPANPHDKEWVKTKLSHMYDIDQYMRSIFMSPDNKGFSETEKNFFMRSFMRRFRMMDWQNTRELKDLLKLHGWFKISEWGAETDNKAWLLVQHADHDIEFQKEILQILSTLYPLKETKPANYAYLFDRVAVSSADPTKRRPQRYGTQGFCVGPGKWEPNLIEDAANVDKRRAEVGLGPMQDYIKQVSEFCQ